MFQLQVQVRIDSDDNDGEKDKYQNEIILDKGKIEFLIYWYIILYLLVLDISASELNNSNTMISNDSTNEINNSQLFLHPPE